MPDGPNTQSVLNQGEVEALENAKLVFGAQAKVEAVEFVAALDIYGDAAHEVVDAIAGRIDGIDKFTVRKEVSEHLSALSKLLGGEAGRQTLQVVAVPVESATMPDTIPVSNDEEPNNDQEPQTRTAMRRRRREAREDAERRTPGINAEILKQALLNRIWPNVDPTSFADFSPEQLQGLVNDLANMYVELKIPRLSREAKEVRARQLTDLFSGRSVQDIAAEAATNGENIRAGLKKLTESVTTRVSTNALDDLWTVHVNRTPETVPAAPSAPPAAVPGADVAQVHQRRHPVRKPETTEGRTGIPGAVDLTSEALEITSRAEFETVWRIFDERASDSRKGPEENRIRQELKDYIDSVQGSDALDDEAKLNSFEMEIFDALVGRAPEYRSPLSLKSIQAKCSPHLQRERVKLDVVVFSAAKKLKSAKQVLRVQNASTV